MSKKLAIQIGLAALLVLLAAGSATASFLAIQVERHVVASGGGQVEQGEYALGYTIGQPIAGVVSSGSHVLCAGFWCGVYRETVYLPLVLRNG